MCFQVLKILKCFTYLKLFKNTVLSTISNLKLGYIFIQLQTSDSKGKSAKKSHFPEA